MSGTLSTPSTTQRRSRRRSKEPVEPSQLRPRRRLNPRRLRRRQSAITSGPTPSANAAASSRTCRTTHSWASRIGSKAIRQVSGQAFANAADPDVSGFGHGTEVTCSTEREDVEGVVVLARGRMVKRQWCTVGAYVQRLPVSVATFGPTFGWHSCRSLCGCWISPGFWSRSSSGNQTAQPADKAAACSSTVRVAASCLSGG